jgi:peroxiredoxin/uncharacterized membrane protein YphA (DoxX/SURF4 family)
MNMICFAMRLALASVFAVAGLSKLADRVGSRQSLREFGVPVALTPPLAVFLPLAELACAVALLGSASAWWGAAGALAMLSTFIIGIVANLAQGRTPDCHCFGKLHSEPVGWSTVARNAGLAAIAGFIVSRGSGHIGPGTIEWFASLSNSERMFLALIASVVVLATSGLFTLMTLLAQNGRMMLRIDELEAKVGTAKEPAEAPGLAANSEAPAFTLSGIDGMPVTLDALKALAKPILLVFTEPGCSACEGLLPDVARWQTEHASKMVVIPIGHGDMDLNRTKSARYGLANMLVQANREVGELYAVKASPSAVLIRDGVITAPLAQGPEEIRTLVFGETLPAPVHKGDLAPSLDLHDADGHHLGADALLGRKHVLLFWNPNCGFCQSMLKDLKSWERTQRKHAPTLVLVSSGTAEVNREQRFRSRVLLDQGFGAGRVFGATGTPSAVLLDEEGKVASDVGVGAPAVLALLGAVPFAGVSTH